MKNSNLLKYDVVIGVMSAVNVFNSLKDKRQTNKTKQSLHEIIMWLSFMSHLSEYWFSSKKLPLSIIYFIITICIIVEN